mmetsp:Transcript_24080/g.52751  ORF Transcript_24080/g.52751 Transcript_24080/m.52751 type:complete len:201 (+) Transcript_24080:1619-2221(+)
MVRRPGWDPVSVDLWLCGILCRQTHERDHRKEGGRVPLPRTRRLVGFLKDEVLRLFHLCGGNRGRPHRNRRGHGPGTVDAGHGDLSACFDRHHRHNDRPDLQQRRHIVRYVGIGPVGVRRHLLLHLSHRCPGRQDLHRWVRQAHRKILDPDLFAGHHHCPGDDRCFGHCLAAVERGRVVLCWVQRVLLDQRRQGGGGVRS